MSALIPKGLFLVGLVLSEAIRFPHRMRHKRAMQAGLVRDSRVSGPEFALDLIAFCGMELLPLVYVFTGWIDFADIRLSLPVAAGATALGAAAFAAGLWLLRKAHAELAANWKPTVQILESHRLVTGGIYARLRHPIYAAVWLMALAQALLLHNGLAGPAGLLGFLPVYRIRVPREERMMQDHFGEEYRTYRERTGRILPRRGGAFRG